MDTDGISLDALITQACESDIFTIKSINSEQNEKYSIVAYYDKDQLDISDLVLFLDNHNSEDNYKFILLSHHVAYEIEMLLFSYDKIATFLKTNVQDYHETEASNETKIQLVFLESFLLHLRNLSEFLFSKNKSGNRFDDLIALDFLNNSNSQFWIFKIDEFFKNNENYPSQNIKIISKYLSHLTYRNSKLFSERKEIFTEVLKIVLNYLTIFFNLNPENFIDINKNAQLKRLGDLLKIIS